jgi:adenine-specific DNA-methyltransferase
MLLIKRVPAKSDKRHLKAAVYLASQFPYCPYISTENKLITVDKEGEEMDARFLHGLYALLNSAVYECYFSILSKSAQVNISDYREIPLPPADVIREIGKTLLTSRQFSARISDILVKNALHITTAE